MDDREREAKLNWARQKLLRFRKRKPVAVDNLPDLLKPPPCSSLVRPPDHRGRHPGVADTVYQSVPHVMAQPPVEAAGMKTFQVKSSSGPDKSRFILCLSGTNVHPTCG